MVFCPCPQNHHGPAETFRGSEDPSRRIFFLHRALEAFLTMDHLTYRHTHFDSSPRSKILRPLITLLFQRDLDSQFNVNIRSPSTHLHPFARIQTTETTSHNAWEFPHMGSYRRVSPSILRYPIPRDSQNAHSRSISQENPSRNHSLACPSNEPRPQ